jgi:hypothetical protein
MKLNQLFESDKKKEDKQRVYVSDDVNVGFPNDTISVIQKEINKNAKDFDKEWKNAIELTEFAFNELKIKLPMAFMKERWGQYIKLLEYAVKTLSDSRGINI